MLSQDVQSLVDELGQLNDELSRLETRAEEIKESLRQYAVTNQSSEIVGASYRVYADTYRRPSVDAEAVSLQILSPDTPNWLEGVNYEISGASLISLVSMMTISPRKLLDLIDRDTAYRTGLITESTKPFHTISTSPVGKERRKNA